jgi:hypothetical protein
MDFGDTLAVKELPDASLVTFADPHFCKSSQFASIR